MLAIAWTTTAQRSDAERLARELIEAGLASCVQVDGPILSVYRWQGKTETTEEYRLMVKLPTNHLARAESYVLAHHPYATPEWVVVQADQVSEKYLSWCVSTVQADPFQP